MLKIGVLGTGHLGKIHLKCIGLLPELYNLVGFFDPNELVAEKVSAQFGIQSFQTIESLIDAVDVVDIVAPTTLHFGLAEKAIKAGKHVFIEKPVTHNLESAKKLIELQQKHHVKIQVGHVERFNPALLAIEDLPLNPMFIEGHRLATFNPRGTDVSVVHDLMIHDLDVLLSLVDAEIKQVHASGVAVISDTADIANARIEFSNGCVANLTASRISLKQMRKIRLFQKDAYISLDFLEKQAQIVRLFDEEQIQTGAIDFPDLANALELDTPKGKKRIHIAMPEIEPVNAIKMELETFAHSIHQNKTPKVSVLDGYKALELAYLILDEIETKGQSL